MVNTEIRDAIAEINPEAIVFDNPSFDNSIKGVTDEGQVIYSYDEMIEELMTDEEMDEDEAIDFICYNTIRAIPYIGENAPIILYSLLI